MKSSEDSLGSYYIASRSFNCLQCTQNIPCGSKVYFLETDKNSGNFKTLCRNCMQKRKSAKQL